MELSIGKLAKLAGVNIDTVRYYERNGLLAPSTRLASGYRRYGDLELARLRFIRRAQKLGFSLKEINSLLSLSARRNVAQVKRAAQAKLADVEARIADLQRVRPWDMYLPEAWWIAHRAFADRDADDAAAVLDTARRWIADAARDVPPAFADSFLQRNAINRAVLTRTVTK